jgi:hypothetical protein
MMEVAHNSVDISGQRFGRLVAISRSHKANDRRWIWACQCDCGKEHKANIRELRKGSTKSCGCYTGIFIGAFNMSHAETYGKLRGLYRSWGDMRYRCSNENCHAYANYGGRGIKVCERWDSFENFMEDMRPTWEKGLCLDRIDPDGDYEPDNCQWLTRSENSKKAHRDRAAKG